MFGASLILFASLFLAIFFAGPCPLIEAKSTEGQAPKPELDIQTGHSLAVTALAYSPNGRLLASGSEDKTVKIWEASTGREIRTFYGHTDKVKAVAFSPDSRMLASGGWDRTVRIWDVSTGRELMKLDGHTDFVTAVSFSRDGRLLASISDDRTVRLWDTATGKQVQVLATEKFPVDSLIEPISGKTLAFSPTANVLAFGSADGRSVILYDYDNYKTLQMLSPSKEYGSYLHTVIFSPDGNQLVTGSAGHIVIWNPHTGAKLKDLLSYLDNVTFGALRGISIGGKGKLLVAVTQDSNVGIWQLPTGLKVKELKSRTGGRLFSVAAGPEGKTLVTGGEDPERVQLWNIASGKRIKSFEGYINEQIDSPFNDDGRRFWSIKNIAKSWNFDDGSPLRSLITLASRNAIAFTPDSGRYAVARDYKTIEIRDSRSDELLITIIKPVEGIAVPERDTLAFSSDGKQLVLAGRVAFRVWDSATGQLLKEVKFVQHVPSEYAGSSLVDRNGSEVLIGELDGSVWRYDVSSGAEHSTNCGISKSEEPESFIPTLAISPDGTLVAAANGLRIKVCKVDTGEKIKEFKFDSWAGNIAFSPDSQTLISTNETAGIRILSVYSNAATRLLTEAQAPFSSRSGFIADGRLLITIAGRRIKIWNFANEREIATLVMQDGGDWVATTPDGRFDTTRSFDHIDGLYWIVPDDPLHPLPLELFMRDYYEPRLLERIVKCDSENTCNSEFKALPSIAELNRVQPDVRITNVSLPNRDRIVNVTVEIRKGREGKSCQTERCDTEVFDLKLFRDGQIVGSFPADAEDETNESTQVKPATDEKNWWRQHFHIPVNETGKCADGSTGCTTRIFGVKLPKGKDAAEITFSAYAFNEDRVKSETAFWEKDNWPSRLLSSLPKAEAVRPTAYVISIGVNASDAGWNLNLAAKDAEETQRLLKQTLAAKYEVVPILLTSNFDEPGKPGVRNATKEKIKATLDLLAGHGIDAKQKRSVPGSEALRKATPDDAIFISISSHGYVDPASRFYLLPSNVRKSNYQQAIPDEASMISSDELSRWLLDVDAGEMVMIIDACYAEASVTGTGFKPAPMGSRGLGQLAYDKQMRILTATRQKDEAIEVRKDINQGLLTAALIQGIDGRLADFKPKPDGKITLSEWLEFTVGYVPRLFQQIVQGEKKGVVADKGAGYSKQAASFIQTPVLFDLRRNRIDDIVLVPKVAY